MVTKPLQPKGRDRAIPALDALIQILEVAKVACVFPPAQVAIGSTSALLMIIKVPSLLLYRYEVLNAHPFRTLWPTNKILSNSGNPAVTFVKPWTAG